MASQVLITVGERIKLARKELHLQQKDVAEAIGVSASHLSEVESGKANPNAEFLKKLSEKYNISVEYIIHGRGEIFYSDGSNITDQPFDFKSDVDTLEKLIWLLRNSPYFKLTMLTQAMKFVHQEEDLIKSSIKKNKA